MTYLEAMSHANLLFSPALSPLFQKAFQMGMNPYRRTV